jgi:hypothetical protein
MLGERGNRVQTIRPKSRFSLHPRRSIPDAARESRIAVGGASAVVDVA